MTAVSFNWQPLIAAAQAVAAHAHAPYSQFCVGVALLTADGQIFSGCNVENVSFPCSQCAEASAIGAMISAGGDRTIQAVVVASQGDRLTWPCGNCRQRLLEFAAADCQVMAVLPAQHAEPQRLQALLPSAFAQFD